MNYIHEVKQMKTNFGAGIIVQRNDGMVLGFCRQKDAKSMPTFGVVGGKVDPGETPQQAAIREAFEEAGIKVSVHESFVDNDVFVDAVENTNFIFHTFRAVILDGEQNLENFVCPGEGRPMWVKPNVLLNSPFKEYNRKMMDFFGINYVNC